MRRQTGIAVGLFLLLTAVLAHPAAAERRRNMPEGWVWPPTPAMKRAGRHCLSELDEAKIVWKRGPKTRKIVTPIVVPSMELGGVMLSPTFRKGPFVMDCHLALALHRHGEVLRQLGVRELRFSTIHEYRRIRMRERPDLRKALSRHALGLAIDVFEIVTDSGEKLVVKDDYRKRDQTLLAVERGLASSPDFRTPLTPSNSPRSHRDHFHLEARVSFVEDRSRTAMLTTR